MSEGTGDGCVAAALDRLDAARAAIRELNLTRCSRDEVLELARRIEADDRRREFFDHQLVGHVTERGFAGDLSVANTRALLVSLVRVSPAEAGRRVKASIELGPRRAVIGEILEPQFPVVAAAQAEGAISAEHAAVITRTITGLPDPVRDEHGELAEQTLVDAARCFDPAQLAKVAQHLAAVLNPDGVKPAHDEKVRRRDFTIATRPDGTAGVSGTLTPECLALLHAALDPLAAPCPTTAGGPDNRTAGQRNHDALQEMCRRLLADGGLPDTGGTPTTVVLTMTLTDLETRTGYATTGHGGLIPVQDALRMAADANLIPVLFTDTGGILAYGRTKRFAPHGQRRALTARDRGCTFPGCDRPAAWTQVHHVPDWALGGSTNIDTMTLTCQYHNLACQTSGWKCVMINGIPWWTPPPWIDPEQKPLRNTLHDTELRDTQPRVSELLDIGPRVTELQYTDPSETDPSETELSGTDPSETELSETDPSETELSETEPSETELLDTGPPPDG